MLAIVFIDWSTPENKAELEIKRLRKLRRSIYIEQLKKYFRPKIKDFWELLKRWW